MDPIRLFRDVVIADELSRFSLHRSLILVLCLNYCVEYSLQGSCLRADNYELTRMYVIYTIANTHIS